MNANPEAQVIDRETRASAHDHEALRVWLRLLTCTNLVETRLRHQLRRSFDSTLARFDLMAQLDRAPDGMKMRELSQRLMVTGGNVTGLTDGLVADGYVERGADPRDRRAYTVRLTAAGRRAFRQMAKAHEAWVIELFGGLSRDEMAQLMAVLDRLKLHLNRTGLESGGA